MSAPFPDQDFLAGAIWCLAYHAGDRFDQLGEKLNGRIGLRGVAPQNLKELQENPQDDFRHRFANVYAPCYSSNFGLSRLERERVYGRLGCEQCATRSEGQKDVGAEGFGDNLRDLSSVAAGEADEGYGKID